MLTRFLKKLYTNSRKLTERLGYEYFVSIESKKEYMFEKIVFRGSLMNVRHKFQKNWRQNTFIKWLFYNSIVFMVTLAICMIAFFIAFRIIEKEITKAHTASLNQVRQIIDDQLKKTGELYKDVNVTPRIREIMWYAGEYEPRHILSLKEVQKQLNTYNLLDNSIFDCYLYFHYHDFILMSGVKHEPEMFYQFGLPHEDTPYEEWYDFISGQHKATYQPTVVGSRNATTYLGGKKKSVILYIQSIMLQKDFLGNFVVLLDGDVIDSIIERSKWLPDANILILNQENEFISNPSKAFLPDGYTYETLKNKSGVIFDKINNENSVISYVQSEVTDWKYISVIPKKVFFEQAETLVSIIIIVLALCLILSGMITYFITLKNYSPVKKIVDFIDSNWGKNDELSSSEFAKIEKTLEKITQEYREMNLKIKNQEDVMREYFLERLLRGNVYTSSVEETIQYYNLSLHEEGSAVLLINLEDSSEMELEEEGTGEREIEQEEIALFIIENIVGELLGEFYGIEKTKVDGFIAFIISMNMNQVQSFPEDIKQIFNKAQMFIEKNFHILFTGAVSHGHIGSLNIDTIYKEALIAYEYGLLVNNEGLQFFMQGKQSELNNPSFDLLDLERQFIYYLTARNFDKARECFEEAFNGAFLEENLSFEMKRCRKYVLVHMIVEGFKKLGEVQQNIDLIYQETIQERLLKHKGIYDFHQETLLLLREAEEFYKEDETQSSTQELCQKAVEIIHAHLQDPNLSVSMIADILGVSVSYVSRYFKRHIGMGALDYIHIKRIEEAKNLLENEDLSVNEVAERVGYINSLSLIRVFKKYEGITPGKYKEIHEKI